MKKYIFYTILMLSMYGANSVFADAPHELAGFVIGGGINDFKNQVEMETALPVRYLESMMEVEAKEIKGYKTGLVTYATCVDPSRIVRLKFKYADDSKLFFNELLNRYKAKFGDPDEWRGDPFHIVIAWKWRFTDKDDNRISLILQHNTRDEEEKQGNVVKMTMWNLINAEDQCFARKHPDPVDPPDFKFTNPDRVNWHPLIPR